MSITRPKLEALAWRFTSKDYRGTTDGVRYVLKLEHRGTCSVPLSSLTDDELLAKIPRKVRLGDLRPGPIPVEPQELQRAYERAHDVVTACDAAKVLPWDIREQWPNVLGFLRRVPGQPYHRAGLNGRDDAPTQDEQLTAITTLAIITRRCNERLP